MMKQTPSQNLVSVFITVHVDKQRDELYTSSFRHGLGHSFKNGNFIIIYQMWRNYSVDGWQILRKTFFEHMKEKRQK